MPESSIKKYKFAAIDIGNSRVKAFFKDKYGYFDYADPAWTAGLKEFFKDAGNIKIGCSSVRDPAYKQVKTALNNFQIFDAGHLLKKQGIIAYDHIDDIGQDRVLSLAGALNHFSPPLITVDCGTAVTVNALDDRYICRGGAIFAGAYTQLTALNNNTDKINVDDIRNNNYAAGKNTRDAVSSGILHSIAGGIKELVLKMILQEFSGNKSPVILTGGYNLLIMPLLLGTDLEVHTRDHLILEGIMRLLSETE